MTDTPNSGSSCCVISCADDDATPSSSCISPQDPLAAMRGGSGGGGISDNRSPNSGGNLAVDEFGTKCTMTNSPDCFEDVSSPSSSSKPSTSSAAAATATATAAGAGATSSDSAVNTPVSSSEGGEGGGDDGSSNAKTDDQSPSTTSGCTGSNCDVSLGKAQQQAQQAQQQQPDPEAEEDDCFAFALANRSACLQRLGSHRHAIADIDLSLASGYPLSKVGNLVGLYLIGYTPVWRCFAVVTLLSSLAKILYHVVRINVVCTTSRVFPEVAASNDDSSVPRLSSMTGNDVHS